LGSEQTFDFRREEKAVGPRRVIVIKRLDSQTIACQQEFATRGVPDREGEHPPQFFDTAIAILFVKVNNNFCVGRGAKLMAQGNERGAQFGGVIALAIVSDPDGRVFVAHGHMPAFAEVDDRETRVP
jgi:hypothetical protein